MATSEGASPARQVAPALDEAQLVKIIRDELDKFFEKVS